MLNRFLCWLKGHDTTEPTDYFHSQYGLHKCCKRCGRYIHVCGLPKA